MIIQHDEQLQAHNTMALPFVAKSYVKVCSEQDLGALVKHIQQHPDANVCILGGGSNTIFTGDFDGLVVHVCTQGIEVNERFEDTLITVAAGENWHQFVRWSIDQGYSGLENLSLIPGQVGAAPVQNIGAYGVEVEALIDTVHTIHLRDGRISDYSHAQCQFAYRDSVFKQADMADVLITGVTFKLPKTPRYVTSYAGIEKRLEGQAINARSISDAVIALRQEKLPDPATVANTGSFFKNPIINAEQWHRLHSQHSDAPHYAHGDGFKIPAAWLIEHCGLKGHAIGDAQVYPKHALVLTNRGSADFSELNALIQKVQSSVNEAFGIMLEPEPVFV